MADITQEQFERYMEEMRANSGAMGKLSKTLAATNRDERKRHEEERRKHQNEARRRETRNNVAEKIDKTAQGFQNLQGDTDDLRNSFRNFARMFVGGALLSQMMDGAESLVRTYKDVAESGQTFNGSVFGMARAAAESGLPLKEFAATLKKNSKVMAVYGQKPVMELAKSVRQNSERFGMYGYTIDGLNDVTMEYMATQRLFGNSSIINNQRTAVSAQKLAHQIGALAKTTGESREHILRITMDAMRDVALTSRFIGNQHSQMTAFADASQTAVAIMASLPGEAGTILSKFVAQTVGWGNSLFAQGADMFINAGMGQMLGVVDQLQREILKGGDGVEGATWEAIDAFKRNVVMQEESLRVLAMSGNKEAETILGMYAEIQHLTKEKYAENQKDLENSKNLSAFMLSFSNIMRRLLNSFLGPIFGGLENLDEKMAKLVDSPSFIALEQTISRLGGKIGEFFGNMKPEDIEAFASGVEGLIKGVFAITTAVAKIADAFMTVVNGATKVAGPLGGLAAGLIMILTGKAITGAVIRGFSTLLSVMMGKVWSLVIKSAKTMFRGGAGGAGGGLLGEEIGGGPRGRNPNGRGNPRTGKGGRPRRPGTMSRYRRMAGKPAGLAARAGRAAIGGLVGVGGLLGTLLGHSALDELGGRPKAAAADAADAAASASKSAKAASEASEAATKAAAKTGGKRAAKIGAKALGKSFMTKLPFIGLGAGAMYATQRFMTGDKVGAGMELASGAASMIPGIGTAASLAMDAALMARDTMGPENIDRMIATAVPKIMEHQPAPASPKTDDQMMHAAMDAQRAATERLEADKRTAATDPQQAELWKQQQHSMQIMETQIALLREQNQLMKKNNNLTTTITHGMI